MKPPSRATAELTSETEDGVKAGCCEDAGRGEGQRAKNMKKASIPVEYKCVCAYAGCCGKEIHRTSLRL